MNYPEPRLSFGATPAGGGGGPPEGFAWVIASPGNYVVDSLGNRLIVESIDMADILLADALAALPTALGIITGDKMVHDVGGNQIRLDGFLGSESGDLWLNGGNDQSQFLGATILSSLDLSGADFIQTGGSVIFQSNAASFKLGFLPTADAAAGELWKDTAGGFNVVKVST